MAAPAEPVYIFVACRNCGGRRLERTHTSWVCARCGQDELHLVPETQGIAEVFDVPAEMLGRPTTYENDQAVQDQTVREMTEIWEGGDMGFKKFGTGEITETEETTTAKTAAKRGEWTEDDNQALARENAQADREDD